LEAEHHAAEMEAARNGRRRRGAFISRRDRHPNQNPSARGL
jgi:hypothetical protein